MLIMSSRLLSILVNLMNITNLSLDMIVVRYLIMLVFIKFVMAYIHNYNIIICICFIGKSL